MAWLAALAVMGTNTATAAPGHLIVGVDVERAGSLHAEGPRLATGLGIRAGYGVDLAAVELVPEGRIVTWGERGFKYGTAELGGRILFLKGIEPGAFARLVLPVGAQGSGAAWTAGGLLDFTLIPKVDLGLHLGLLSGRQRLSTVGGAHLSVNF